MPRVELRREIAAPADAVWAVVTDWPRHGDWVAGTTVRRTSAGPDGVGTTFVARTGSRRLGFDDPMEVTAWEPPSGDHAGRCVVLKHGRVVLGTTEIAVRPLGAGRSRLDWVEDVEVAGIRRLPGSAWVTRQATRLVFGSVCRKLAHQVEASGASAGGTAR